MNAPKICAACRYWDQSCSPDSKRRREIDLHGHASGLCRRYPPHLDAATYAGHQSDIVTESPCAFVQPLTWSDDWCGEFDVGAAITKNKELPI